MIFFGWGKSEKVWVLASGKQLVAIWSYIHIFWCPIKVSSITWYIIGDNRSEDLRIPSSKLKELFPDKIPDIGTWNKYGLLLVLGILFVLGPLGLIL